MIATLVIVGVLGAIIGSFLSVCIFRLPFHPSVGLLEELRTQAAEDQLPEHELIPPIALRHSILSIGTPARSECLECGKQLLWWHNIPVISWLLLRGKCGFCQTSISVRYPVVELLSCGAAVLSVITFGLTTAALVAYLFCATAIVISFIDYDWYIIPDLISYGGTAIALVIVGIHHFFPFLPRPFVPDIWQALIGVLFGAGFLWFISFLYLKIRKRDGLGLGDVKLLAIVGALFGLNGAFFTIFVGSVLGTVGGVLLMLFYKRSMEHPLPFGPYLLIATVIYLFFPTPPVVLPVL